MNKVSGFTLVEVLVAITVMAISLTGIAMMETSGFSADSSSRRTSEATALAQAKLEELRGLRQTNAAWTEGAHGETGLSADGASGGGPYARTWEVVEDYDGHNRLSRVTVTVFWDDGEVSFSSLYW